MRTYAAAVRQPGAPEVCIPRLLTRRPLVPPFTPRQRAALDAAPLARQHRGTLATIEREERRGAAVLLLERPTAAGELALCGRPADPVRSRGERAMPSDHRRVLGAALVRTAEPRTTLRGRPYSDHGNTYWARGVVDPILPCSHSLGALRRRYLHELCGQLHRGGVGVRRRRAVRGWQLRKHRRLLHRRAGLPRVLADALRRRQLHGGQLSGP